MYVAVKVTASPTSNVGTLVSGSDVKVVFSSVELSPIAEEQLRASLMMSDGNLAEILTRPYALLFLALAVLTIIWPNIAQRLRKTSNYKRNPS